MAYAARGKLEGRLIADHGMGDGRLEIWQKKGQMPACAARGLFEGGLGCGRGMAEGRYVAARGMPEGRIGRRPGRIGMVEGCLVRGPRAGRALWHWS